VIAKIKKFAIAYYSVITNSCRFVITDIPENAGLEHQK
jgi:hypothetical protein